MKKGRNPNVFFNLNNSNGFRTETFDTNEKP
jgi:hypothetical protein